MTTIAHISDLHVSRTDFDEKAFLTAVEEINALKPDIWRCYRQRLLQRVCKGYRLFENVQCSIIRYSWKSGLKKQRL